MRKAICAVIFAAFLGCTGAADAGGLTERVSFKDEPPIFAGPVWTGFYAGIGVGAGSVVRDVEMEPFFFGPSLKKELGGEGILGTVQAGYDFRLNGFVLGVFVDYDFTDIEIEGRIFLTDIDIKLDDMWSVGGRLGYLVNESTLIYGLLAYTEANFDGGLVDDFSGYSVGAGLETHLRDGWFVKGEYRYTDLDSEDYSSLFLDADIEPSIHSARLVLSYKLGRGHH